MIPLAPYIFFQILLNIMLKGNAAYLKKIIMDENDALSEYNKIPFCHNRTNGDITPNSTSKLRSALHFRYSESSHASFPSLILLNHNNHYNHGFPNTFDYNHYVYGDYLVYSVPASDHIIRY